MSYMQVWMNFLIIFKLFKDLGYSTFQGFDTIFKNLIGIPLLTELRLGLLLKLFDLFNELNVFFILHFPSALVLLIQAWDLFLDPIELKLKLNLPIPEVWDMKEREE